MAVNVIQTRFRFRVDRGTVDGTPVWGAGENVNYFPGVNTVFRIRFEVQNTGTTTTSSVPWQIFCSQNGGAYSQLGGGGGSNTPGLAAAYIPNWSPSIQVCDSTPGTTLTVRRLTADAGTFSNGKIITDTGSNNVAVANAGVTEFEWALALNSDYVSPGDTLDFRVYYTVGAAPLNSYTQTPRITIPPTGTGVVGIRFLGSAFDTNVSTSSSVTIPNDGAAHPDRMLVLALACNDANQGGINFAGQQNNIGNSIQGGWSGGSTNNLYYWVWPDNTTNGPVTFGLNVHGTATAMTWAMWEVWGVDITGTNWGVVMEHSSLSSGANLTSNQTFNQYFGIIDFGIMVNATSTATLSETTAVSPATPALTWDVETATGFGSGLGPVGSNYWSYGATHASGSDFTGSGSMNWTANGGTWLGGGHASLKFTPFTPFTSMTRRRVFAYG